MGFDISSDGIDALEVFLGNTRHRNAKIAIDEGDDFKGIHGVKTDFFAKKRSVELENVTIDAEVRHKEGLEIFFNFVNFLPHNIF